MLFLSAPAPIIMSDFINKKRFKVITTLNLNFLLSIEKTLQSEFIETSLKIFNFQFSVFNFIGMLPFVLVIFLLLQLLFQRSLVLLKRR